MNEHTKNHATSDQVKNIVLETNSPIHIRLENLINDRVQLLKKKHWCWTFVRENSVTMSCIISVQRHITNIELVKLSQSNVNLCPIDKCNNNFIIHNSSSTVEGSCMLWDRVKDE